MVELSRRRVLAGAPALLLSTSLGSRVWARRPTHRWGSERKIGSLLVKYHPGLTGEDERYAAILARSGARLLNNFPTHNTHHLAVRPGTEAMLSAELEGSGLVEYAEPDYVGKPMATPNDPYFSGSPGPQTYLTTVNAPTAWNSQKMDSFSPASQIPIFDIDTGIQATGGTPTHPDLTANVTNPWNVLAGTSGLVNDTNGHGTRVGGILGATTNNSIGIASVGWNGVFTPIQAGVNNFTTSDVVNAQNYILSNFTAPGVINHEGEQNMGQTAIDGITQLWAAGFFIMAPAGDSGSATCDAGICDSPYTLGVSWCDDGYARASLGSYGPSFSGNGAGALICAPGGRAGDLFVTTDLGGGYTTSYIGASFACPVAAAAVRFAWQANPNLTNRTLWKIVTNRANGHVTTGFTGVGAAWTNPPCVDMNALLQAVLSQPGQVAGGIAGMAKR